MTLDTLLAALRELPIERRYAAGVAVLNEVQRATGADPLTLLRALLDAAGDPLDRTALLPTGPQRIALN